jgi:SM-20-related protein
LKATPLAPTGPLSSTESLTLSLEQRGFGVALDGLPPDVALALAVYAARVDEDHYHAASIGRGTNQQRNRRIRRDRIHWMDDRNPLLAPWRDWTESLRVHLNQQLFLGLFSFESHLAHYRPGDFYLRHVDAFRGEANRIVSLVCYLNENWNEGDGGELVLYTAQDAVVVQPVHRTVALFLSEEIAHEVKPARRDRYSVTGWFRLNSSSQDRVDPPR